MSLSLNSNLFTETGTDSGELNVLGTLVHRFPDEGDYVVTVTRDGRDVGEELIVVDEEYHSRQATVDVSTLDTGVESHGGDASCEAEAFQCIRPGGHGVFHVGSGAGGYSVVVDPIAERDVREFDGSELTDCDRFAVTLMRPGIYTMRNLACDVEGQIEVRYPDPDDRGGGPGDPVEVTTSQAGFDPSSVTVDPAQGVVFDVQEESHIQVELETPHDDATEDPDSKENVTQSPDQGGGRANFEPDDLSIDEVVSELEAITRQGKLKAMLLAERASENRDEAIAAIKERLRGLD